MSAPRLLAAAVLAALAAWSAPGRASPELALGEAMVERPQRNTLGVTFQTTSWLSVELGWVRRLEVRPAGGLLLVGAAVELPVLLWIRTGSVDTARASGRVAWVPLSYGVFRLAFDLELGLGTQTSVMGTWVGAQAQLSAFPGLSFRRGGVGLLFACRQGLSTYVHHADYVRSTFEGRYPEGVTGAFGAPQDGWIAFPFRRYLVGIAGTVHPHERWTLSAAFGLSFTARSYAASATDLMPVGEWPFFASLGLAFRP